MKDSCAKTLHFVMHECKITRNFICEMGELSGHGEGREKEIQFRRFAAVSSPTLLQKRRKNYTFLTANVPGHVG